jgi:hypothetical protein
MFAASQRLASRDLSDDECHPGGFEDRRGIIRPSAWPSVAAGALRCSPHVAMSPSSTFRDQRLGPRISRQQCRSTWSRRLNRSNSIGFGNVSCWPTGGVSASATDVSFQGQNGLPVGRAQGRPLTRMYGPAARCKWFRRAGGERSCINVSGL